MPVYFDQWNIKTEINLNTFLGIYLVIILNKKHLTLFFLIALRNHGATKKENKRICVSFDLKNK